jgi:hypothetical protein
VESGRCEYSLVDTSTWEIDSDSLGMDIDDSGWVYGFNEFAGTVSGVC